MHYGRDVGNVSIAQTLQGVKFVRQPSVAARPRLTLATPVGRAILHRASRLQWLHRPKERRAQSGSWCRKAGYHVLCAYPRSAPPHSAADWSFGNTQPSILTVKTTAEIADAKLDNQTLFRQVRG